MSTAFVYSLIFLWSVRAVYGSGLNIGEKERPCLSASLSGLVYHVFVFNAFFVNCTGASGECDAGEIMPLRPTLASRFKRKDVSSASLPPLQATRDCTCDNEGCVAWQGGPRTDPPDSIMTAPSPASAGASAARPNDPVPSECAAGASVPRFTMGPRLPLTPLSPNVPLQTGGGGDPVTVIESPKGRRPKPRSRKDAPRCKQGCGRVVGWGWKGQENEYCIHHKKKGMVRIKVLNPSRYHCKAPNCTRTSLYNFPGKPRAFCADHKEPGMIDRAHKPCKGVGCSRSRTCGWAGKAKEFCKFHKLDGMVTLTGQKCIFNGCTIFASFGLPGAPVKFCLEHKPEGACPRDILMCIEKDCNVRASFGPKGERSRHCLAHKTLEDCAFNGIYWQCAEECCNLFARYGPKGGDPLFCYRHRDDDHHALRGRLCEYGGCHLHAIYGNPGEPARFCIEHKRDGDITRGKVCKTCLTTKANRAEFFKGKDICARCHIYVYPNIPLPSGRKRREAYMVDVIKTEMPGRCPVINWMGAVFDRKVPDGCSRKRPDMYIDCGTHNLVVEIDEGQHSRYDTSCDQVRSMLIMKDAGSMPIWFIRFNPDQYQRDGKYVQSPFQPDRYGVLGVAKEFKKDLEERCEALLHAIEYAAVNIPPKDFSEVFLFFDHQRGVIIP